MRSLLVAGLLADIVASAAFRFQKEPGSPVSGIGEVAVATIDRKSVV